MLYYFPDNKGYFELVYTSIKIKNFSFIILKAHLLLWPGAFRKKNSSKYWLQGLNSKIKK
jgi:hypothetical protein